jgi:protocatechuate 3,4-dioxygenase beta subunit
VHCEGGATIGGRVVDEAGNPVADATIDVDQAANVKSGRDGTYLVVGVAAGARTVTVSTETLGAAQKHVTIARGGHLELDVTLAPSTISGTVVDTRGEPTADVIVHAEGAVSTSVASDATGHFDVQGVPPGDYVLTADRAQTNWSKPDEARAHTGDHAVHLVIPDAGSITGRVVMNGQPVDYFGIALTDDLTSNRWASTDPVRSSDGRFTKARLWPRTLSVALVGPNFERKVIPNVRVPADGQLDLGDIEVSPGRVLRGHVVDEAGTPVEGAAVIAQRSDSPETEVSLDHDLDGRRGTWTDAAGRFELAGLPADATGLYVQASAAGEVAPARELVPAELDADVRIVLARSGSIAGTIVNGDPHEVYFVTITSADSRTFSGLSNSDGTFQIELVPAGDYVATFTSFIGAPIPVHVAAGAPTPLTLTVPTARVGLDIELAGGDCMGVTVTANGRWLAQANCDNPRHAGLDGFAPGTYTLCNQRWECTVAEVAASPARQTVIIPASEPSPSPPPEADPSQSPSPSPSPDPAAADPAEAADEATSPED